MPSSLYYRYAIIHGHSGSPPTHATPPTPGPHLAPYDQQRQVSCHGDLQLHGVAGVHPVLAGMPGGAGGRGA